MKRVAQDPLHGLLGFAGIALRDSVCDGGMVFQVSAERLNGHIEHGTQNGLDGAAKASQDWIVGCLQDRQVEILVGRDRRIRVGLPAFHGLKRSHDPLPHRRARLAARRVPPRRVR